MNFMSLFPVILAGSGFTIVAVSILTNIGLVISESFRSPQSDATASDQKPVRE